MLSLLYPLSLLALAAAQSPASSAPVPSATASANANATDAGDAGSSNTTAKFWIEDSSMTIGNGTNAHFDPNMQETGAIWLRNPDLSLTPNDFAVSSDVMKGFISMSMSLPYGTLPGDNYTLILTTQKNRSDVIATSAPFSIYAPGSTSNNATAPSGLTSADVSPPHGWTYTTFSLPSPHYYWVEGADSHVASFGMPAPDGTNVDMWIANANATLLAANVTTATNFTGRSVTLGTREIGNATAGSKYFLVLTPTGDKNFDNALAYSSYFDIKPKGTKAAIDDQAMGNVGSVGKSGAARLGAGYATVLAAVVAAVACVF